MSSASPRPYPVISLFVALYGWAAVAVFGAVLLDAVYAGVVRSVVDSTQAATVFSAVSDFLLFVIGVTALAAIGAIGSSWDLPRIRNLLIASAAA